MSVTTVRWAARALSVLILLFWGFFLVASLFGDATRPSRPLVVYDWVILGSLLASLAGLAVAWKWELAGAALTLGAILVCALVNWRVVVFPGTLIPVTAGLYLACWWASKAPRTA
ncbi:MAG TPA: hypothetical protein VGF55_32625 [Gemmataceae bacterium]|jgi:hypothetical protein